MGMGSGIGFAATLAVLLAGMAGPALASGQESGRCGNAVEVAQLPDREREMVAQVLEGEGHGRCEHGDCEFHVEHMADGRYLVKLRERRFVPADEACVTAWMSETGFLFDATGKAVDIWPYCLLMAHEATIARPDFTPDPLPYKVCQPAQAG